MNETINQQIADIITELSVASQLLNNPDMTGLNLSTAKRIIHDSKYVLVKIQTDLLKGE